jgi:hypothetical protein
MKKIMKKNENQSSANPLLSITYETYCQCNAVILYIISLLDLGKNFIPVRQAFDILLSAWTQKSENAARLRVVSHDFRDIDGEPIIVINWSDKKENVEYLPHSKFSPCLMEALEHQKSIFLLDEDCIDIFKMYIKQVSVYVKDDMVPLGSVVGTLLCSMEKLDENEDPAECITAMMGKRVLLEIVPFTHKGASIPGRKGGLQ